MAGLGIFILIVGALILFGGIIDEDGLFILIGFVLLIGGGVMKEYADAHNPIKTEERKQELLRDELQTLKRKRNTWKYYQKLKKGNLSLEKQLKDLKNIN